MWEKPCNLWTRFKRILRLSMKCHRTNLNSQRAVTLTYYTLFAIVPLAALLFGITQGFRIEEKMRIGLLEHFPNQRILLEKIFEFSATLLERTSGGIVAGIGILALLWSGFALANNVDESFGSIWGLPRRRKLFYRFNSYITILFLAPFLLIVLSSANVLVHSAAEHIQALYPQWNHALICWEMVISKFLPLLIACGIFFLFYFFVPNTKVRWRAALFAAILAGIAYQAMQDIFLIIQKKLFSYNQVYGSFAVLPLFLIWVQWAWQIVLYGAEIGFVTQNLHTGLFDLKVATPISSNLKLIQQLTVTKIVFRNVQENRGATAWAEIARRTGLAEVEIDRIVAALINAGIIEKIKKDKSNWFLPVIPADSSLFDCICRLRTVGRNAIPPEMKKECDVIVAALGEISEAEKTVAGDKYLCKL